MAVRVLVATAIVVVPSFAALGRTADAPSISVAEAAAVEVAPLAAASSDTASASAFEAASWTGVELGAVQPDVFALALHAAATAIERGDVSDPATLTVIDFSRPSTQPRMWVYDLRARALLFEELVAHGRASGANLATQFSNVAESNQSSLGLYRTAEPYIGKHGYSLRLDGLERGFNNHARARAIVVHGAEYVNGKTAVAQGRLGRSLGCPAVRPEISRRLIDAVKGGGLIFAYYPDPSWLATSTYLN